MDYTADCVTDADGKESCKTLVHDIRDVCPVTCALFEMGVQNPMTQRRLEPVDSNILTVFTNRPVPPRAQIEVSLAPLFWYQIFDRVSHIKNSAF